MQTALQLSDMLAHRKHASLRAGKQSHVVVGVVVGGCLLFVVCCSMGTKLLWERSNIGQSVVSNFHLSRCFGARKG